MSVDRQKWRSGSQKNREVKHNMAKTKITPHTYVCELPDNIQHEILTECEKVFKSLAYPVNIQEELETVACCKMCDLEDTINVQKYYTRL